MSFDALNSKLQELVGLNLIPLPWTKFFHQDSIPDAFAVLTDCVDLPTGLQMSKKQDLVVKGLVYEILTDEEDPEGETDGTLPFTGIDSGAVAMGGLLALLAGGALIAIAQRRAED